MVNDKQFIISQHPDCLEGWKNLALKNGKVLSCQPLLQVCSNEDNSVVLLGHAWQALPNELSPAEIVSKLSSDISLDVAFDIEKTWCGRYILICNDWLLLDNCGMLGVFYSADVVASSMNVMHSVLGSEVVYPDIEYGHSPDFVPGPLTATDGVKRLLPSQILNLKDNSVQLRQILPDGIIDFPDEEARLQRFVEVFDASLHNLKREFADYHFKLALTGGKDSRLLMCFLENAGLDYDTFTAWHPNISEGDKDISAALAKERGKNHSLLKRNERNKVVFEDYRKHTAGYAVDQDMLFWSCGQYEQLRKSNEKVLILRSSIWECTDDHYRHHTDPLDIYRLFPYALTNKLLGDSVEEWKKLVASDSNNKELNSWTRLFWDLREGSWLSSIEQSYDVMDGFCSVQPCNCRLFMSILLGFDEKKRFRKIHELKLMNLTCPQLAKLPFDDNYNGYALKEGLDVRQKAAYLIKYICARNMKMVRIVARKLLRR